MTKTHSPIAHLYSTIVGKLLISNNSTEVYIIIMQALPPIGMLQIRITNE